MRRTIFATALALLSLNSFASEWQRVGGDDTQASLMDFSSIATVGKYKKAWVQTNYFEPKAVSTYSQVKYSSERFLFYFDCAAKTITSAQWVRYEKVNGSGNVIDSEAGKFNPARLADVVPDSMGERYLNLACGPVAELKKVRLENRTALQLFMDEVKEPAPTKSKKRSAWDNTQAAPRQEPATAQ